MQPFVTFSLRLISNFTARKALDILISAKTVISKRSQTSFEEKFNLSDNSSQNMLTPI